MERSGLAATALREAVAVIDRELGAGYAAAHPDILQRYLTIAGMEFRQYSSSKGTYTALTKPDNIDQVSRFMNCATEPAPLTKIQARHLYTAFVNWCRGNQMRPISEKAFCITLKSLGYRRELARFHFWLDVKLKDETQT